MKILLILLLAYLPLRAQITVGGAYQISATCSYKNSATGLVTTEACNNKDAQGDQAKWTSTTPTIASVNTAGLASGLKAGTTTLFATIGSVKSNILTLTVAPAKPKLISVSISAKTGGKSLSVAKTVQMEATCVYSDGTRLNCNSSDTNGDIVSLWKITHTGTKVTASISSTGLLTGLGTGAVSVTAVVGTITSNTVSMTIQ